jgi:hypothetical protein
MKLLKSVLLASFAVTAISHGAVTLTISSNAAGFGVLTGLQNSSGAQGGLVWGIVVDGNNNGFQGASPGATYDPTFTYSNTSTNTNGFALTVSNGVVTDDRLFISTNLMATSTNTNDGGANFFRPTLINNVTLGSTAGGSNPLVNPGDAFAIIWFDVTSFGGNALDGQKYGLLSTPTTADPLQPLVLGNDTSGLNYAKNFIGTENARPANLIMGVPEPSAALLGALGALGLLRRRRN